VREKSNLCLGGRKKKRDRRRKEEGEGALTKKKKPCDRGKKGPIKREGEEVSLASSIEERGTEVKEEKGKKVL